MKLFDVLKENALKQFASNYNPNVYIGPDTTDKELVSEVQKALSKHSLAIGKRPEGQYWDNSRKGWTGGITGIYDNNLKAAVMAWQESVNNQIKDMAPSDQIKPLLINGVINQEDAKVLTIPLDKRGFLSNTKLDSAIRNYELVRREFTDKRLVATDVNDINSFSDFMNGIGREGWFTILTPIVRVKYKGDTWDPNKPNKDIINFLNDSTAKILKARNKNVLFNTLREVLRPLSPNFQAKTKSGKDVTLIPDDARLLKLATTYNTPNYKKLGILNTPKSLYIHFAGIAMYEFGLGVESAQKQVQAREKEDQKSLQNDTPNLNELDARRLAEQLVVAFENNYWAIFSSARVSVDDASVEQILQQLANAKDYDEVAKQYLALTEEHLSVRMLKELSKDDLYQRIFIAHMKRIRRINPPLLHSTIKFDDNNTPIAVTDKNNKTYEVTNEMVEGRPIINPEVVDVILEDYLLREAITKSGGTIPSLIVQPTEEDRIEAVDIFIDILEATYPELTSFYAHLPPFSEYSPIGLMRLKGIIEEAIVYTSAGTDPTLFIEKSLKEDRIWLVGDGSDADGDGEPDPGNANIYFDPRYSEEGLRADPERFDPAGVDDDDLELSEDDLDIIEKLASGRDDLITAGIEELFEMSNARTHYIKVIYPGYKKVNSSFIEQTLGIDGKNDWVTSYYLEGGATPNMPMFELLLDKFAGNDDMNNVIAFVAPAGVAKVFEEILGAKFDLNEDVLTKLVKSVQNKDDFELVEKYYENGSGNLRDDIKKADWFSDKIYQDLLKKVGIDIEKQDALLSIEEWDKKVGQKIGHITRYRQLQTMSNIDIGKENEAKEQIGNMEDFIDDFTLFVKDFVKNKDKNKNLKDKEITRMIAMLGRVFTLEEEGNEDLFELPGWKEAGQKWKTLKNIRT